MSRPSTPWWVRPSIVLPGVLALVALVATFAQAPLDPRGGDQRLSTLSSAPLGAALLYELAQRLGWEPERQLAPTLDAPPEAVLAVLGPVIALRSTETHALLEHVRGGGAALVVVGATMQNLMDSLHLRIGAAGTAIPVEPKPSTCTRPPLARLTSLWFGREPTMLTLRWAAPAPAGAVSVLSARTLPVPPHGDTLGATVIAFPYGTGRIVVSADADVFRTDAMRDCKPGFDVVAVRALEYLRDGGPAPRTRIVFDEYHQAHGAHPGSLRAAIDYLGGAPSGRLLMQLSAAGLLLLVASAPRSVPPASDPPVERRSPLEQVDALARADEQVRATGTASRRLVHGLRRRVERGSARERAMLSDDAWLERIASRHPALAAEVAQARRALTDPLPPREFAELGPALHRIETTLS